MITILLTLNCRYPMPRMRRTQRILVLYFELRNEVVALNRGESKRELTFRVPIPVGYC